MTAIARRGLLWLVTACGVALGGLLVFGCVAILGGCGASAWQRAASATAIAAVEVEHGASVGFQIASAEARADLAEDGNLSLETWCEAVAPAWDVASRVQCSAAALADLARGADAVIQAGETPSAEWAGAACSALRATTEVWEVTGNDVPTALESARDLLCGLAGPWRPDDPPCVVPPVPGCEVK